jgi:hypothetical protein
MRWRFGAALAIASVTAIAFLGHRVLLRGFSIEGSQQ